VVTIDSATGAVTRNVEYYALGHASRFVRPGARRVASNSGVVGLDNVAFRNPDGSKVLIVVNTAAQDRTFEVRWSGKTFRYSLPPGAVATFAWK
jgi:glucosylceramidase